MTPAGLPADEAARQRCLHALDVLDGPPDAVLDGLVRCAAQMLGYPVALISLVDDQRQWFMARQGLAMAETPRDVSLCAHVILGDALFEVPDARVDPRFADNPLVTGALQVRAYAGVPIAVDGHTIGTLCLIDHQPRRLTPQQGELLADLGRAVAAWFAARREHLALQTERACAAERLQMLEHLAEQVPGMLFQYRVDADGSGRFPFVSAQVQELFAIAPEALGSSIAPLVDRVHPDDRAGLLAALADAAATGSPWQRQFRVQCPGQPLQWRSARAAPTRLGDGAMLWHGFVSDVTEQAEIEQLRRDKLAAERASHEKTSFLSRVSHELRTPLNAMLGFTQLLEIDEQEPLTPRQRERLKHAHRAALLLLGLINDVLDLSRIEQGARDLSLLPLRVSEPLGTALNMVAQLAQQARVTLCVAPSAGSSSLVALADRRALEQVLLNLLSNGIKYNRRGGTLTVSVGASAEQVRIDVTDQGRGLDARERSQLFQPFNRLGAETTQVEGSGLGLVIARQLAEAMGGQIEVSSQPQVGSTFSIVLPRHAGAAAEAAPSPDRGQARPGHDGAEISVLYVEDDPVNALLVQEALRTRTDWQLLHAADGRSGLALAQALQPTVVLTDINLPGLSGLDLVRALRRDPLIGGTICIALSADAMPGQVETAMQAGFDDYWTKPLDVSRLAERIDAWLDRGDSRMADLDAPARQTLLALGAT